MSDKYIFVLGGTKSATSSIFRYLGDHPEITPSLQKQADFFLDKSFSRDSDELEDSRGIGREFNKHFPSKIGNSDRLLLDVSPDYFCSKNARQGLEHFLANREYELFVIVRNPVDRLVSWFQYGKQIGLLSDEIDFNDYVEKQDSESKNAALSALNTGRFMHYLNLWQVQIPKNRINVLRFDALTIKPSETMAGVATTLGISEEFYNDYEFYNHNKTQKVKSRRIQSLYVQTQRSVRYWMSGSEFMNRHLTPMFSRGAKFYRKLNAENTESFVIDDAVKKNLESYYDEEMKYLENGT